MTARFHESAIGSFKCRKHHKDCYTSEGRANAALYQILAEVRDSPHYRDKIPCRAYFEKRCGFWHLTSQPKRGEREMPYVKWGQDGSDVYVYGGMDDPPPDGNHVIICCGCLLRAEGDDPYAWISLDFRTKQEILDHLAEHEAAGHVVPDSAISAISNDDWLS